jgi:hypothetical protein
MSITSLKMNIFELFKNENWSLYICPQTDSSQFLSLAFKNCAASIEKCHFFQKRPINQEFKIPSRSKKKLLRKKFFHEVFISIGRINVQKISQIGDGHLVGSYKRPLFVQIFTYVK